jgi:predicted RNase H-like HicB family nuclease
MGNRGGPDERGTHCRDRACSGGWLWTICLEIPGAIGQGVSLEEAKNDLQAAIELLLQDREADVSRGLPADAVRMPLQIG